jgi:hypothetical protein
VASNRGKKAYEANVVLIAAAMRGRFERVDGVDLKQLRAQLPVVAFPVLLLTF